MDNKDQEKDSGKALGEFNKTIQSEKADLKFEVSLSYLEQLHESGVIEKRKLTYKE